MILNDEKCVFVFLPDTLENSNVGYLTGYVHKDDRKVNFYITSDRLQNIRTNCIGYCGLAELEVTDDRPRDWIRIIFFSGKFQIESVLCDGIYTFISLCISYDYKSFLNSNVPRSVKNNKEDFPYLTTLLNDVKKSQSNVWYKYLECTLQIPSSGVCHFIQLYAGTFRLSSTYLHLESSVKEMRWVIDSIRSRQSICVEVWQVLESRVVDFLLGMLVLVWLWSLERNMSDKVSKLAHDIITGLHELLTFLMGSPVGLKLNNAFTSALGNFFIYHIALWRKFLLATGPAVGAAPIALVVSTAALGLSFQLALAADVLSLATLHVYCVYVYAARLYGVQTGALLALWRLFLGRKRNPLRGDRVDTFTYTSDRLFVGTLAFTVLLFLLPTTALYYVVFATLRLALFTITTLLDHCRQVICSRPLCGLRLCKGTPGRHVRLHVLDNGTLYATLHADKGPAQPYVIPKQPHPPKRAWNTLLKMLLTGRLI